MLDEFKFSPYTFPLAERLIHDYPLKAVNPTYKVCHTYELKDLKEQLQPVKKIFKFKTMKELRKKMKNKAKNNTKRQRRFNKK
jgi:hypothetical protein